MNVRDSKFPCTKRHFRTIKKSYYYRKHCLPQTLISASFLLYLCVEIMLLSCSILVLMLAQFEIDIEPVNIVSYADDNFKMDCHNTSVKIGES